MEAESFLAQIKQANDYHQLFVLHQKMQNLIQHLQASRGIASASSICKQISGWHDQLIRHVTMLAEQKYVSQSGHHLPPFGFLLFGSSAREEPTFWTDQDNGLIYTVPPNIDQQQLDVRFKQLANMIVAGLHQAGYPLCRGNVMASSDSWRYTQMAWQEQLKHCIENPSLAQIRFLMIAADMRLIYGDEQLAVQFYQRLMQQLRKQPAILQKCWQFIDGQSFPLGIFRNWLKEHYGENAGSVQLKRGGYHQLVGMLRLFSIRYGVLETSSGGRIKRLAQLDPFFARYHQEVKNSLDTFLEIRLIHHLQIGNIRNQPEDYIQLDELTEEQQADWKTAINWVKKMKKAWRRQSDQDGFK